jgi:hypothetical protein
MPTDVAEVASDPISQICALCRWGSSQPKVLRWQQFAGPLFPQSEAVIRSDTRFIKGHMGTLQSLKEY